MFEYAIHLIEEGLYDMPSFVDDPRERERLTDECNKAITALECYPEMEREVEEFRKNILNLYAGDDSIPAGGFDEILCYELHSQPKNPREHIQEKGLTFTELAQKWGISVNFLGKLIADHCKRLENQPCST